MTEVSQTSLDPDREAKIIHPPFWNIRLARRLRFIRRFRGGGFILERLARSADSGEFVVSNRVGNRRILAAGNISSFIDRHVYIFGGYEQEIIKAFLALVPKSRRRTILDVGGNFGTHSLFFSQYFESVHSFEPNPSLWNTFERNISLNGFNNVTLHCSGLADKNAELPFHLIEKTNLGLGTFSTVEQYDLPLKKECNARVVNGDEYLIKNDINNIDAIKIDVQGFEPEVLLGLKKTM